jgi:hypothetical protein
MTNMMTQALQELSANEVEQVAGGITVIPPVK